MLLLLRFAFVILELLFETLALAATKTVVGFVARGREKALSSLSFDWVIRSDDSSLSHGRG